MPKTPKLVSLKILAIETSCDETAAALVSAGGGLEKPRFKILSNVVASQIKLHRAFGGVVPNLAKREHLKNLPLVLKKALAGKIADIDLIAVTVGPGLEPALWAGINFAEELAKTRQKPLIGVNHLEGHLYSQILKNLRVDLKTIFPAVALLVSGGHTILLLMSSLTEWKKLGETRDDAAGEAFDKVARLLNLPYPGGPEIEKLAQNGNQNLITFPRPMINQKNYDFSFSGLKTAVLYYLRDNKLNADDSKLKANVAASFQKAAVDALTAKTIRAVERFKAKSIILCGGVAANKQLRRELKDKSLKLKANFFVPDFKYNTDNAAMIAASAYINYLKGKKLKIIAQSNLNL